MSCEITKQININNKLCKLTWTQDGRRAEFKLQRKLIGLSF